MVDAGVEEFTDRIEVARLARDDATRGVVLVKLEAQLLGVQKDPLTQIEQNSLTDPRGEHRVPGDQHGTHNTGHEENCDSQAQRHPVAVHEGR